VPQSNPTLRFLRPAFGHCWSQAPPRVSSLPKNGCGPGAGAAAGPETVGVALNSCVRWAQGRALTLSLLALISLCSTTVSNTAAAANKRVAVYVVGPGGEGLSAELVLALPAGVGVIEFSKLVDALAEQHIKNLGAALNSARQRKTLTDPLRAAAKAIGADAIVLGGVPERKTDRDKSLQLVVLVTSASGLAVDERVPLADKAARSERFQALVGEKLHELGDAASSDAKTGPPDASGAGQANTSEAPAAAAEAEAGPATLAQLFRCAAGRVHWLGSRRAANALPRPGHECQLTTL